MPKQVVKQILPTTMVGSYPRPGWFKHQLLGRDVRVAFKEVSHEEAYQHAVATVINDQIESGLDIVTDGNMWYDDYVGVIGSFCWYLYERIPGFEPTRNPHPSMIGAGPSAGPNQTPTTVPAVSVPRRYSSRYAWRMNVAWSASRAKYDSSVARAAPGASPDPRRVVTVPIATVRTSAHRPPTSGTIAPSALTCCTAGPAGGGGASDSRRASSASWTAT